MGLGAAVPVCASTATIANGAFTLRDENVEALTRYWSPFAKAVPVAEKFEVSSTLVMLAVPEHVPPVPLPKVAIVGVPETPPDPFAVMVIAPGVITPPVIAIVPVTPMTAGVAKFENVQVPVPESVPPDT
jgi:hypothetical protein